MAAVRMRDFPAQTEASTSAQKLDAAASCVPWCLACNSSMLAGHICICSSVYTKEGSKHFNTWHEKVGIKNISYFQG